jgi:hypothetical protein
MPGCLSASQLGDAKVSVSRDPAAGILLQMGSPMILYDSLKMAMPSGVM